VGEKDVPYQTVIPGGDPESIFRQDTELFDNIRAGSQITGDKRYSETAKSDA
jgi:hypothetical protein